MVQSASASNVTRRNFLKVSTAAAAALAAAGVTGCAPKEGADLSATGQEARQTPHVCESDVAILEEQGRWVPYACEHGNGCGGNCNRRAYVVDNTVLRCGTNSDMEDSWFTEQRRPCLRGRARRTEVFGASRIRYPMKRKSWQPGGGEKSHGELRGKDEWEQISWDEALDLAAGEIKRIYDTYGPTAVINFSTNYPYVQLLSAMGGYVEIDDTTSLGTGTGDMNWWGGTGKGNDKLDYRNADYITMIGANATWSAHTGQYKFLDAKESGTQFIYIGPARNVSASQLEARWIPVRPGTDTAFFIGVAYEMLALDEAQGNVVDREFLDRYTLGFDGDHMPDDAVLDENYEGYLRGEYDGTPKTAEWASLICGAPVEDIRWYAETCAKGHNHVFCFSHGASRNSGAENFHQALASVVLMGGHIGKPGNAFFSNMYDLGAPSYVSTKSAASYEVQVPNPVDIQLHCSQVWRSILNKKTVSYGTSKSFPSVYHEGVEHDIDIKLIASGTVNYLGFSVDTFNAVRAFRQAEFVLAQDINASASTMFADIVLPACSQWEGSLEENVFPNFIWGSDLDNPRNFLPARDIVVAPLYECRSHTEIARALADRLGLNAKELYPMDEVDRHFARIVDAQLTQPDGTQVPLIGLRRETLDRYGSTVEPQEGVIDYEDYLAAGGYMVERSEGDAYSKTVGLQGFIEDPVANPRPTASGLYEIYSQTKADNFNKQKRAEVPIKPYPNYYAPTSGYETTFADWDKQIKGDFPFQMFTMHHIRTIHTNDYEPWVKEAFPAPAYLNAADAEAKGIESGDTIRIWNAHGGCVLRRAELLNSVMPGCIGLTAGLHLDLDESDPDNWIDRGGNCNVLTQPVMSNYNPGSSNYNNGAVNYEKYDGEPLAEDCERDPFAVGAE